MIFDIIFIILFALAAFKGYNKGFILQLTSLLALILGIYGAIKLSSVVSKLLIDKLKLSPEIVPIISFAVIFIGIVLLINLLGHFMEKIADLTSLGFFNRLFGAIFNVIKYALIISVFLVILNNINRKVTFLPEKQMKSSVFYYPLSVITPLIYPYLRYNFFPHGDSPLFDKNEIAV